MPILIRGLLFNDMFIERRLTGRGDPVSYEQAIDLTKFLINRVISQAGKPDIPFNEAMLVGVENPIRIGVSALTEAGSSKKPNEDSFAVHRPREDCLLVGVFDGTTTLVPIEELDERGISGARFASQFVKEQFGYIKNGLPPMEILTFLNERLLGANTQISGVDQNDANTLPATSATVVKIDPDRRIIELAHVYDSWCIVYYKDGHSELVTKDLNRRFDQPILNRMGEIARIKGITPRQARQENEIEQALVDSRIAKLNAPNGLGCGVINGEVAMKDYIQTEVVSLVDVYAILLGTDGFVPPGWSIQSESGRQKMIDIVTRQGLEGLMRAKRQAEDNDPEWNFLRFKNADDATGVFLKF